MSPAESEYLLLPNGVTHAAYSRRDLDGSVVFWLTVAVWGAVSLLWALKAFIDYPDEILKLAAARTLNSTIAALLCYPFHRILKASARLGIFVQIALAVLASTALAILYTRISYSILDSFFRSNSPRSFEIYFNGYAYWETVYLAWAAIYVALSYRLRLAFQVEQTLALSRLANEAKLQALRYQIDPHFLFNALNSISSLVVTRRNDGAECMVAKLAAFFRQTLDLDPNLEVTLAQEVRFQRLFLEIEQVRFPDMQIKTSIDDDVADAMVPALLLQPIVENAVKHGVTTRVGATTVSITATRDGDVVRMAVINDGAPGSGETGAGTGLANVRERVGMRFGDRGSVRAEPTATGFAVHIEFPAESAR